jgi:hypothetical protein
VDDYSPKKSSRILSGASDESHLALGHRPTFRKYGVLSMATLPFHLDRGIRDPVGSFGGEGAIEPTRNLRGTNSVREWRVHKLPQP